MALYRHSGVSVESWVEMTECVPMRYEIDSRNDRVALYFGQDEDYVLVLRRDNLRQMATLADQATSALAAAVIGDD